MEKLVGKRPTRQVDKYIFAEWKVSDIRTMAVQSENPGSRVHENVKKKKKKCRKMNKNKIMSRDIGRSVKERGERKMF